MFERIALNELIGLDEPNEQLVALCVAVDAENLKQENTHTLNGFSEKSQCNERDGGREILVVP